MATQIRGSNQIKLKSITFDRLVDDFLQGITWNVATDNSAKIIGLADPTDATGAATKHYVDSLLNGKAWKAPVRVFADSNVSISNPPTSIDGVTLATGDRIALFNQTTGSENGVYIYNGSGSALTRADDWEAGEGAANWTFWVQEGTNNADKEFTVTNDSGSDVIGTDSLTVIQSGGSSLIAAGAGLYLTGNTINVGAADNSILVNADNIQVQIGSTNGTSLEVTATGLELAATVTGARTFQPGSGNNFVIDADANAAQLTANPDGTVDLAIATVKYVNDVINSTHNVYGEAPTVTAGSTDVTLAHTPLSGSERVYLNGLRMKVSDDYSISGGTISFVSALQSDDTVVVDYVY